MESEETFEGLLVVLVDYCDLGVSEDKRGEARHQDRDGVQLVNVDARSRVSTMTLSHAGMKDTRESFPMSFEALKDGWFIASNTSKHANMFCRRREWDFLSINLDSTGCHRHGYRVGHLLGGEHLKLGLLSAKLNIVLGAEHLGELEEVEEFVHVVTDQSCIISLAYTGNY